MGGVNNLERFVNRGWHGLSGYIGHGMQHLGTRNPNSELMYHRDLGGYGSGVLLGRTDIAYKIPHSRQRDPIVTTLLHEGNIHDSISEQLILGIPPNDIGLTKQFEVYQASERISNERVLLKAEEKKWFGLKTIPAVYRTKPPERVYTPVYSDEEGTIGTESSGNERLLGMIFEFADSRWPRGLSTAQYSVVLREPDYVQLRGLLRKDPSIMLKLLFAAFPAYQKLEGQEPCGAPSNFVFAETLDELMRFREKKLAGKMRT